jgi:hypothetical protein
MMGTELVPGIPLFGGKKPTVENIVSKYHMYVPYAGVFLVPLSKNSLEGSCIDGSKL